MTTMAEETVATKVCWDCGDPKPLNEFHVDRRCPDGHTGRCKACAKAYTARKSEEHGNLHQDITELTAAVRELLAKLNAA